ncbi:MAG: two-CW domain-containing protein, partial [Spirochaetota bacterium]
MENKKKINCWEYMRCKYGPESENPCPAVVDETSNRANGGINAGRICWIVPDTLCYGKKMGEYAEKKAVCSSCEFFNLVKEEEGTSFHMFKLARGVTKPDKLHTTLSQIQNLIDIHKGLHSEFDIYRTFIKITGEARRITGAQRSVVFLIKGNPPALHGEFKLRGKKTKVVIKMDETSAVGFAASRNRVVNLRDVYMQEVKGKPVFNTSFDKQCNCETHSFLAVPVRDSEGRVIGVITAANAKKGFFSADDEWFMHTYATEVALAVEKNKFIQQSISALRLASIGETIAGLSHCIKNIAHALRGSSYIIKKAIESNDIRNIKSAWEILDRHIESLANLSLDVLTYEPEEQKSEEGVDLNQIISHVTALFREEARTRAITVNTRLGDDVKYCSFDPRNIYRCVVNLVINALDACPFSEGVM